MIRFAGALLRGRGAPAFVGEDIGRGLVSVWSEPGVALLATNGSAGGFDIDVETGVCIAGDINLRQRGALCQRLGLDSATSDVRLALKAFLAWGPGAVEQIEGDFSLAIWDPRHEGFFCARDPFGVKPFFYAARGEELWFGSDGRDLRRGTSCTVNAYDILQFINGVLPTGVQTFQREIQRLRAGSAGWVKGGELRQATYYRLTPASVGAAPAETFRALFCQAVNDRIEPADNIGAMLSGGLDSSSIVAVAARERQRRGEGPLATFSRVYDETPQWNERPFIEAITAREAVTPTYLPSNGLDPFAELDAALDDQDGPFLAPGLTVARVVFRAAADAGFTVLLDGHGGDEVVSHGWGRLTELARDNRFYTLWREAQGVAATYGDAASPLILGALLNNAAARPFLRAYLRARRLVRRVPADVHERQERFLNPDTVQHLRMADRARAEAVRPAPQDGSEAAMHRAVLEDDLQAYGLEVLHRNAAGFGLEIRYPFWDRRLVEFCLGLDAVHKLDQGWTRRILRLAMEGVLPAQIQWRRDKLDFSPHLIQGLLLHGRGRLEQLFDSDTSGVGQFVNLSAVRQAYQRLSEQKEAASSSDLQAVWRTAVLSRWLERTNDTLIGL